MSLSSELMTEEQKMIRGFRGVGAIGMGNDWYVYPKAPIPDTHPMLNE